MKTILFPTDFSKNAEHAAQYAGMLARSLHARVVLFNVYSPIFSKKQNEFASNRDIAQSKRESEDDLKEFTSKFIEQTHLCSVRVIQCVEYGDSVSEKIVERANLINAHYIVMGTKGASNIINKWLGTNAQKVMETAKCPVWIIPDKIEIKFPKKIMYAADFKEDEFLSAVKITQMFDPIDITCKVIHIHDFWEKKSKKKIQELVEYFNDEFKHEKVFARNINRQDIIEGLEAYINLYKPDVLSLAIKEKSIFEKFFEVSISEHFVQQVQIPLLTFRK